MNFSTDSILATFTMRRYVLLKTALVTITLIRLCIGLLMAILAVDHMKVASSQRNDSLASDSLHEVNITSDNFEQHHRSTTNFDLILNGTEQRTENPVPPEAALIASISMIVLCLIGLFGLLRDSIVWVVSFGLLSVLFLILRIHSLIQNLNTDNCPPSEPCIRDELVNTVIGIVELLLIAALVYELRLRMNVTSARTMENAFPDLRTSVPTVMNMSEEAETNKMTTDVEEFETSLALKKHQTSPVTAEDETSNERRRSSTKLFSTHKRRSDDWM
jgi:hypothetical protein